MMQNICGKESPINTTPDFHLGMYAPATDSILINTGENSVLIIRYKECNFSVTFDNPNDVVYLYRQAKETPLLYAKLALKKSTIKNTIIVYNFSQPCPRNNFYQVNCI